MQATLHKKSGGMHHVKKSGGMKHMKKTGGMATTKKTGGMKKAGGMNMTKKSGGKCGMPLATSGGMQHVKKSGGMHHKTVKGGMYHSKKHGGSRKLIKGGAQTQIEVDGKFYEITTTKDSVTVKAMEPESFEATKVPVLDEDGFPLPPPPGVDAERTEIAALNETGDAPGAGEGIEITNPETIVDPNVDDGIDVNVEEQEQSESDEDNLNKAKEAADDEAAQEGEALQRMFNPEEKGSDDGTKSNIKVENPEEGVILDDKDVVSDSDSDEDEDEGAMFKDVDQPGGKRRKRKGKKSVKKGGKHHKKHGGSLKKKGGKK